MKEDWAGWPLWEIGKSEWGRWKKKMTVWQTWGEGIWRGDERGAARVRLILLLGAWRLTLCVSDWSDQYVCRPEMCFLLALWTDVTVMSKQRIFFTVWWAVTYSIWTIMVIILRDQSDQYLSHGPFCVTFFSFLLAVCFSTVFFFSFSALWPIFWFSMLLVFLSHLYPSSLDKRMLSFFPLPSTPYHLKQVGCLKNICHQEVLNLTTLVQNQCAVVTLCLSVILGIFPERSSCKWREIL